MEIHTFGILVRRRRKALGLTQGDLALQVGCSTVTIRKIEADERRPSQQMAERLARFLEVAPEEQTEFLRAARVEDEPTQSSAIPNNLPAKLTQLIGRDALLVAARNRLLRPEARLLTLIGTAGVGKTSLALQLAADCTNAFADGVFFVSLAAVERAERVLAAIAETLGATGPAQHPDAERLREHIGNRHMLLVLDNMEHVLDVGGALVDLLAACPALTLLVTSRVALRVNGEQTLAVPPLEVPGPTELLDVITLQRYPAAELFLQRAHAARHDFLLTNVSASAIGTICARLDGLPLAIELVAARSNLIEPTELAQRLTGTHGYAPLQLGRGAPHLPSRQRTIQGAIDWSFHLLEPHEQRMLAQLGVFVGGFDLRGAEAICMTADIAPTPIDVLEGLQTLIDAHLLVRQSVGGETRFEMLQTIRTYALEQLEASGRVSDAHARHATHFDALAAEADAQIEGPDQQIWIARLEREHDNLRAALGWALNAALPVAAQIGQHMWWFWLLRGHWREGLRWLNPILQQLEEADSETPTIQRADLCKGAATLAKELTDYPTADRLYRQALAIYRACGDRHGLASTLNNFAGMLHRQGRAEEAIANYQESLEHVRALGLRASEGLILGNLSVISQEQGQYDAAQIYHEQGLAISREQGDLRRIANALTNFGELGLLRGELADATERYDEALALYEAYGDPARAHALHGLGLVAYSEGAYARSLQLQQQALRMSQEVGDIACVIQSLEGCAHAAGASGSLTAAVLYGTTEHLRATLPLPLPPIYRDFYVAAQAQASQRHDRRVWAAMVLQGRSQPLEKAIADALALRVAA